MALPYFFLPDRDEPSLLPRHRGAARGTPVSGEDGLPADPADRDRVLRIRAGEDATYTSLFLELHRSLREFAVTYAGTVALADEIVQDVFLDLWVRRVTWAPAHGIRAYLFRAVRNRAADVARHARVADRVSGFALDAEPAGMGERPMAPGGDADMRAFIDALRDVLMALPPARHRAALLRWRHGLSYAEIAETLGTSVASVTMHVARAREAVRPVVERFTRD